MIPKVIHYCWFGRKNIPKSVMRNIETWKKNCPDYQIVQWNEDNFNISENEFIRKAYEEGAYAFVSDYVRLKVIYDFGGIYLDTDVEIIKSLDPLLQNDAYLCVQQGEHLIATGLGFGAKKNSQIVKAMLDEYSNLQFNNEERSNIACPWLNTKAAKKYGFQYSDQVHDYGWAKVFPPRYADPYAPGSDVNLFSDETFSIHHYDASWSKFSNRLKLKIYNCIGMSRITKIKKDIKNIINK